MKSQLCFQIFLLPFYLILFGVDTILVSGQCQINHQTILIQLKNELQFESSLSTKLVSWKPNATDCCSWGGVTCSIDGQVIGLDLSNEMISGGINDSSALFGLKNLESLNLAANKFSFIPISSRFGSLASLSYMNLSNSGFSGQVPGELSQLTRLEILDLSEPFSFGVRSLRLEKPNLSTLVQNLTQLRGLYLDNVNISAQKLDWGQGLSSSLLNLEVLSLSNCQLSGPLDDSLGELQSLSVIRLALNNLSSPVPEFFANFKNLTVLNLASCNLTGRIPDSICNATYLRVLDLARNRLTGTIPKCLIEFGGSLRLLDLANNRLTDQIEGTFPSTCGLNILDLRGNSMEGKISRSLVNCTMLEVLDIGNNRMNDTYPCYLGSLTNLSILVLRNNRFHGSVRCPPSQHNNWSKLQIVDIACNEFSGAFPDNLFLQWGAMMTDERSSTKHLSFRVLQVSDLYYQDTVTVTVKGLELELVKILTIFKSIDISSNRFSGVIPETIGQLKALILFNMSHNEFTGSIPQSMGNLSQLESLDMSWNNLTGNIPSSFTSLNFLSTLNLSYNQLEGRIPTSTQLQSFEEYSYIGNKGLCGPPSNRMCSSSAVSVPSSSPNSVTAGDGNDWQTIFYGMGAGAKSLIVVAVLFQFVY